MFEYGEKKTSFVCACTEEEKIYREGFAQNGCYGNQPHSFEVVFYSIGTNTSYSFTEQDSTFKQAYCVSLCFVLCKEPKSCQLTLGFSPFYRPDLEMASFCNTWNGQIISCHATDVKMLRFFFWFIVARHCWSLIVPSSRNLS